MRVVGIRESHGEPDAEQARLGCGKNCDGRLLKFGQNVDRKAWVGMGSMADMSLLG